MKKEQASGIVMQGRTALVLLLAACLMAPFVSASEPGVNDTIDVVNTPISSISHPDVSTDGVPFTIEVVLTEEAATNGTTVAWEVQQCINSGVCYPPEMLDMTEESGVWSYTISPVGTHTYLNYEIDLNYSDGTVEVFPEGGFIEGGKVWSDCWVVEKMSGGDNCPLEETPPSEEVPAPGLLIAVGGLALAAVVARRADSQF